jgi:tetratricopeptide (TPR) repeat protein
LSWSIALNGFVADAYFERAKAHRQLGQTRKAKADLEKARQLDPQVGDGRAGRRERPAANAREGGRT